MKERKAQRQQRKGKESLVRNPQVKRRSTVNWHESELLVKHKSPEEPVTPDDVGEYLDQVEAYARAVLNDLDIDDPVIPLPLDKRHKLHDQEHFEETADGSVALKLLEYVSFLKDCLDKDPPTRQQVLCMLWMMSQISALTSMPYLGSAVRMRGRALDKQRSGRQRDAEIRRLRADGEKILTLSKQFDLSERQIKKILAKK